MKKYIPIIGILLFSLLQGVEMLAAYENPYPSTFPEQRFIKGKNTIEEPSGSITETIQTTTVSFSRPAGVSSASFHQKINIFNGVTLKQCTKRASTAFQAYTTANPPTIDVDYDPICQSCSTGNCKTYTDSCREVCKTNDDGEEECEEQCTPVCTERYITCSWNAGREQWTYVNTGGAPNFNHRSIEKYGQCTGDYNPSGGEYYIYDTVSAGSYRWDNKEPRCVPASATHGNLGKNQGSFMSNKEVNEMAEEQRVSGNSNISSIYYKDGDLDANNDVLYTGGWTNKDVYPRSLCADKDSGCTGKTSTEFKSHAPLTNRQTSYTYGGYSDNAKNQNISTPTGSSISNAMCASTVARIKDIKRECSYTTTADHIGAHKDEYTSNSTITNAYSTLNGGGELDAGTMRELIRLFYVQIAIKKGKSIDPFSKANWGNSLNGSDSAQEAIQAMVGTMELSKDTKIEGIYPLVYREDSTCTYEVEYEGTANDDGSFGQGPLIDKLTPMVTVTATSDGESTGKRIIDNANNFIISETTVQAVAYTQGARVFTAGWIDFQFDFKDPAWNARGSFSKNQNSDLHDFAGVSEVESATYAIEIIENQDDTVINRKIFTGALAPKSSESRADDRLTDGSLDAHSHTFTRTQGNHLTVAGLYKITVKVFDNAGNLHTSESYFKITANNPIPCDPSATFDTSDTRDTTVENTMIGKKSGTICTQGAVNNTCSRLSCSSINNMQHWSCINVAGDTCDTDIDPEQVNGRIPTIRRDLAELLHGLCSTYEISADYCAFNQYGGFVVLEDDYNRNKYGEITSPLTSSPTVAYADANSLHRFHLTFYDRYFNLMAQRTVNEIQQTGSGIYLNSVKKTGESAIHTQLSKYGMLDSAYDDPSVLEPYTDASFNNSGSTNTTGDILVRSFSYTPGIFDISFTGTIQSVSNPVIYAATAATSIGSFDGLSAALNSLPLSGSMLLLKNSVLSPGFSGGNDIEKPKRDFFHIFIAGIQLNNNEVEKIQLGSENTIHLKYTRTQTDNIAAGDGGVNELWSDWSTESNQIQLTISDFLETLKAKQIRYQITQTGSYTTGTQISSTSITLQNTGPFTAEQVSEESAFSGAGESTDLTIQTKPYTELTFQGKGSTNKTPIYWLSENKYSYTGGLELSQGELNRIYIGGYKQTQGKERFVIDRENIISEDSTIPTQKFQDLIYKNAAFLTRNRTAENAADMNIVNGVWYVSGDVEINNGNLPNNSSSPWHTLIVEDGNITFTQNTHDPSALKSDEPPVSIVILNTKGTNKMNIQIKPDVQYIHANIYTEGSVISVDSSGNIFSESDIARIKALQNQLVIVGSVFSRNTVGGAVWGGDEDTNGAKQYIIPNGLGTRTTNDLNEAVQYDLAFLRLGNKGYDDSARTEKVNEGHPEGVVILTDASAFSKPNNIFNTDLR